MRARCNGGFPGPSKTLRLNAHHRQGCLRADPRSPWTTNLRPEMDRQARGKSTRQQVGPRRSQAGVLFFFQVERLADQSKPQDAGRLTVCVSCGGTHERALQSRQNPHRQLHAVLGGPPGNGTTASDADRPGSGALPPHRARPHRSRDTSRYCRANAGEMQRPFSEPSNAK